VANKIPQVELAALKKIAPNDVRLLWVNDWYDGPREAIVEHDGECCLMVLYDEVNGAERPYRWLFVRLTPEQRADEQRWHDLFVEHVGDHWCFHGQAIAHTAPSGAPDPEKFYGPYRERPPLDMTGNTVLGWADEMPST
jgi:hypothetical protein